MVPKEPNTWTVLLKSSDCEVQEPKFRRGVHPFLPLKHLTCHASSNTTLRCFCDGLSSELVKEISWAIYGAARIALRPWWVAYPTSWKVFVPSSFIADIYNSTGRGKLKRRSASTPNSLLGSPLASSAPSHPTQHASSEESVSLTDSPSRPPRLGGRVRTFFGSAPVHPSLSSPHFPRRQLSDGEDLSSGFAKDDDDGDGDNVLVHPPREERRRLRRHHKEETNA